MKRDKWGELVSDHSEAAYEARLKVENKLLRAENKRLHARIKELVTGKKR